MNPETLRVPFVEVQASVLEELQRKAAAYDALTQRQAVKAEPVAYGLFWQNHEGEDVLQFRVAGSEENCKDDLKHYSPEVQKQMTIRPLYTEPLSAAQGVPEGSGTEYQRGFKDGYQRQAVKAEPAIEALSMIGEVLGLDEDDAGPTPIIDKIVCLQEAFETVKRLHLIATNQVVDLRKAAKPEPLSAAQGVPEGWQPIETAPKDGTVIIALQCWIYHTDAARRPHYVLHEVFFNDDGDWEVVEDGEILDEDSLTHWLPRTRLPAAPEQAESKEKK